MESYTVSDWPICSYVALVGGCRMSKAESIKWWNPAFPEMKNAI